MQETQLLFLSDYFAVTPHHDYFLPLNSQDLSNFVHGTSILCFPNWLPSPKTVSDCTMALFANNVQQVKEVFLAVDHKAPLNHKQIANAVKKDHKIFKSLAEPMLDGQIEIPQEWPNTSDIITLVALCFVLM